MWCHGACLLSPRPHDAQLLLPHLPHLARLYANCFKLFLRNIGACSRHNIPTSLDMVSRDWIVQRYETWLLFSQFSIVCGAYRCPNNNNGPGCTASQHGRGINASSGRGFFFFHQSSAVSSCLKVPTTTLMFVLLLFSA